MSHSPIYQRIYDARRKYTLPGSWSAIPAPTDCFLLAEKPSRLLAQLESEFGAEQLQAAGVASASKTGESKLAWNPVLLDPLRPIWAAKLHLMEPISALVVNGQSLDGQANAMDLAIRECPDGFLESPHTRLVVANTMSDFTILRSLGIPAIPGPRRFEPEKTHLANLLQMLRICRGPASGEGQFPKGPVQLSFCDWDLSALTLVSPASVHEAWSYFRHGYSAASVAGFGEFRLWKPTDNFLKRFGISILRRNTFELRKELEGNLHQSSVTVKDAVMRSTNEQATLRAVYERLDLECRPPQDLTRGYGKHEVLQSLVDAARIRPLIDLAERTGNELEREMLLNLIGMLRAQLPVTELITTSIRQQLNDVTKRQLIENTPELRQEMMDLSSEVTSRLMEINRCVSSFLSLQTARRKNKSKQRANTHKKEQSSSSGSASHLRRWPR